MSQFRDEKNLGLKGVRQCPSVAANRDGKFSVFKTLQLRFLWGVSVTFCVLEPGYLALGLCLNASQLYAISRKLNFLYLGLLLCTMEIINNCIDFKVVAGIEGVNASKGLGTMPGTR